MIGMFGMNFGSARMPVYTCIDSNFSKQLGRKIIPNIPIIPVTVALSTRI